MPELPSVQSAEVLGKITRQLQRLRYLEMHPERRIDLKFGRNLADYTIKLGGLKKFLGYVRENAGSNTVLDVGAGRAVAVDELAVNPMSEGLHLVATGLVHPPEVGGQTPRVPFLVTSGEFLEGVEDTSVGGIIAVDSLIYSASPESVVDTFDRVLTPGGAVKASMLISRPHDLRNFTTAISKDYFSLFQKKGYDVAVDETGKILLAIKPGGSSDITAAALLLQDLPQETPPHGIEQL